MVREFAVQLFQCNFSEPAKSSGGFRTGDVVINSARGQSCSKGAFQDTNFLSEVVF